MVWQNLEAEFKTMRNKSEEGVAVMQNLDGVVPHEIKSGQAQWQYEKMDAGAMYYHPQYKAFVQREPRTEGCARATCCL